MTASNDIRRILDAINESSMIPIQNISIIKEERNVDFTDALLTDIQQNQHFKEGDAHQAILDLAYGQWQSNEASISGYDDMINHTKAKYGNMAAFAVLVGKYNQQVENGGHTQYHDNGYDSGESSHRAGDSLEMHRMMMDFMIDYGFANSAEGSAIYKIMKAYDIERADCHDCDGNGTQWTDEEECHACNGSGMSDDEEECGDCDGRGEEPGYDEDCWICGGEGISSDEFEVVNSDSLDTAYYAICKPWMDYLNKYFYKTITEYTQSIS